MAKVVFSQVSKRFGPAEVLKPLDLEIPDGELLVLIGPPGSGKSTLLRLVAGLETPTTGRVQIGDRDVTRLPPKDRDVAMVFQNHALYPHLTVRENLSFGLESRGTPQAEIEAAVAEASSILTLDRVLDRRPQGLSGGQRQRVAIGRAIVRRPAVFLFDEPLSELEATLKTEMRAEITRLHQRLGITTIYVTNDQVEAMTLASRLGVIGSGVLHQIGAPLDLFAKPVNGFVGCILGTPAMNQLPGTVREGPSFEGAGFVLRMPHWPKALVGKSVSLGVRPQSLVLDESGPIRGVVEIVEHTGSESYVRVRLTGEHHITVRVEGTGNVRLSERVALGVRADEVRVFVRRGTEVGEALA